MIGDDQSRSVVEVDVQSSAAGEVTVAFRGLLNVRNMGTCWRALEERLPPLHPTLLDVDASQLEMEGSAGIAMLRYLSEGGMTPGAKVTLRGLSEKLQGILNTFTAEDLQAYLSRPPAKTGVPAEVGAGAKALLEDLREQIAFIGS